MKQNWNRSGREESGRVPGSDRIRGYLSVLYSFRRPLFLYFFLSLFFFFLTLIYVLFFKRIFKRAHLRESTQKNIRKKLNLETNFTSILLLLCLSVEEISRVPPTKLLNEPLRELKVYSNIFLVSFLHLLFPIIFQYRNNNVFLLFLLTDYNELLQTICRICRFIK